MPPRKTSGRAGPRRMLAIGLVGTGLYAGLIGSGAAAEPAAPAIVAGASPEPVPEAPAAASASSPGPGDTAPNGSSPAAPDALESPASEPEPADAAPDGDTTASPEAPAGLPADPAPQPSPTATPAGPQPTPVPVPPAGGGPTADDPAEAPPEPAAELVAVAPDRSGRDGRRATHEPRQRPNVSLDSGRLERRRSSSPTRAHRAPRRHDGAPTSGSGETHAPTSGPMLTIPPLLDGLPTAVAVPDQFVASFRIPPVLLPIYQAAGIRYGVRWEVLAAINEIETDYGRNLNVSSAGARGWMQFMPATWKAYGVDANGDGAKDPYHPSDAIFAAARYLRAAGAGDDLSRAIYAYNHADWYVDSVLMRARLITALPEGVLASLTWLGRGRLPVPHAYPTMRDEPAENAIRIFAPHGARVVAVNGGTIVRMGRSPRLGRYLKLRDLAGNTYIYGYVQALPRASREHSRPRRGAWVAAGTVLGRVRRAAGGRTGSIQFAVRPTGSSAPRIDPRPILSGWRLRRSAVIDRLGTDGRISAARAASLGRILEMSKEALVARVLADPRIDIYACGRNDIRAGVIDRRVLATLEYLAASGLRPTVSSLTCGHSVTTSSGNISEHSTGSAVDIAAINGVPILGHQGPGSITELVVQRLAALSGRMKPHQIITLMRFAGADNTIAMADHADHIHIGWRPRPGSGVTPSTEATLDASQWIELIDRLGKLDTSTAAR
jgi:hypothetical protein